MNNNGYEPNNIALRIRKIAKNKNIVIKQMLSEIGLAKGTLDNFKTSVPKADNLARLADYLDCSVDYLLGRTDSPNISETNNIIKDNHQNNVNGNNNIQLSATAESENEINSILSGLTPRERTELMMMIYQFADEHKKEF